jgi:hypothetical protein
MSEKVSESVREHSEIKAKLEELDELVERVEELVEEIEIEEFGKRDEHPPRAKRYIIRIDKVKYTVHVHRMTGRQLLTLAGKVPPDQFTISQKFHGGRVRTIGLDEEVDFTHRGVERFMTLPLDQKEG